MACGDDLLSGLIDGIPVGVFAEDIRSAETFVNDQMLEFAGLTRQEIGGAGWAKVIRPLDRDRILAQWCQMATAKDRDVFHYHYEKPDGTVIWLKIVTMPRFDADGRFCGYVGTATDESRSKVLEDEHRDTVTHLQAMLDNFPGVIFRFFGSPSRLELLFLSEGAEQLTGFSRAETLVASSEYLLRWVHPEDRALLVTAFGILFSGQKYRERIRLFRPDGTMYWVDVRISVVDRRGGGVVCEGMALDVTQEMDARQKLQWQEQEHIRLEHQMQEARKLESLGRLSGGIAHDFNNLLGAILGFAQFVAEDVGPDHPAYRNAGLILDAADRGRGIVAQILAFARQTGTERRRFRLEDVVTEINALIRMAVPAFVTIEITANPVGLMVEANRTQLGQVLLNLCMNARDALDGDAGKIAIKVEVMSGHSPWVAKLAGRVPGSTAIVDVWSDADGTAVGMVGTAILGQPHVALVVSDNGIGMDAAQLSKVFDPFFTTKDLGKGTGLGLSVVHSIVLAHDGAVVVRSRPGLGSEIRIILPAFPVAGEQVAEPAEISYDVVPGRVLVVDDDRNFGEMLAQLMSRNGWDVVYHKDPFDAFEAVKADPAHWDLVITDQVMPNFRGQDMIAKIKTVNPDLPCILCTGYDETITEAIAKQHGAALLLFKPMTAKQLLASVAMVMNGSGA